MGNVPHPLATYLVDLQKSVQEAQRQMQGKLDRPHQNFAEGKVWAGPAADRWGTRLSDQRRSYNTELSKLGNEVAERLAKTPPTCTEDEATDWKRRLGLA
ncbi:hypothetical protein OG474_08470 [Kribbella sp. NBC_01505]|uniref:hypothetical protein n=1 Tax=Kribbella sp. NBC_01505 TaxID=2903580 RepID=UPI0038676555